VPDNDKPETEIVASPVEDAVHPNADGFRERITAKEPDNKVFLYECQNDKCLTPSGKRSIHFRHAGYVKNMLPYLKPGGEKRVGLDNLSVMVCVKCRRSYVWIFDQMYDVTDRVDLEAWEKFEVEAHRATGPGGDC
jgi:hypothetical protein